MNILITANQNYFAHLFTLTLSVYKSNGGGHVFFFLHNGSLPEGFVRLQNHVEKRCKSSLIPLFVDCHLPSNDSLVDNRITEEAYYRLFAIEKLPSVVERALWLDVDIVVQTKISELYMRDMDGYLLSGVIDGGAKDYRKRLGIRCDYINSGMMLINVPLARKTINAASIYAVTSNLFIDFKQHDQDVINLLAEGQIEILDPTYNSLVNQFDVRTFHRKRQLLKSCSIVHYAGVPKPWDWRGEPVWDIPYLRILFSIHPIKAVCLFFTHRFTMLSNRFIRFLRK